MYLKTQIAVKEPYTKNYRLITQFLVLAHIRRTRYRGVTGNLSNIVLKYLLFLELLKVKRDYIKVKSFFSFQHCYMLKSISHLSGKDTSNKRI